MPREVKPLKWLVVDLLAAHVDELVEVAGESLLNLPPDVRQALLAVARRKGVLDDAALVALVDESFAALDVSGCGDAVTDAGVRALAAKGALRSVVTVDVTGCAGVSADGLRALILAAPKLEILRCGGDPTCDATCRAAIAPANPGGGVLPRLTDSRTHASLESWEALDDRETLEGARSLRWLVWPDIDRTSRGRVAARCLRVRVVAPSPEVSSAAREAAQDVHFVAVTGEGWVGWGAARRGDKSGEKKNNTSGRSENNDGLVLVAAGHTGASAERQETSSPWWYPKYPGDKFKSHPPKEADPTTALDFISLRFVRSDVYGDARESARRRARGTEVRARRRLAKRFRDEACGRRGVKFP